MVNAWALPILPVLLLAAPDLRADTDRRADAEARAQPEVAPLESTLREVIARVDGKPTLSAGERGALEVHLELPTAATGAPGHLAWAGGDGLTVRVAAPPESGILFDEEQQLLETEVQVSPPAGGAAATVSIPYRMSSRVRVKDYTLQLFVTAPLVDARGGQVQDSGLVALPVRVETQLRTKLLVLAIIALAIFLFVVEWVRVDVVAILMMVSLPLLNLLSSRLTFTGLSSNAVVAIIGVMVVSAGLNKVGLVSRVVRPVIKLAGSSASRLMVSLSALIAVISSVMQNTGAAVLFLPGIRHACKEIKTPISGILMPIGMCAILGGTLTMIGTSPLILLNDILPAGMEKFGLLELTPIGAAFVISGIIYFSTVGRFFLKKIIADQATRGGGAGATEAVADARSFYHELDGPFELSLPESFALAGDAATVDSIRHDHLVNIVAVADGKDLYQVAPAQETRIRPSYDLCVYGPAEAVREFAELTQATLHERPQRFRELFNPAVAGTVEAVVSPRSDMAGHTIREIGIRKAFGVTALALFREGKTYYEEMSDIPLMPGDAFLLHATWEQFQQLQEAHRNMTIITPLEVEVQKPSKATPAIITFGITLALMLVSSFYFQKLPYNPIPLSVCLMTGALLMVLTRVLSIKEVYAAVDWRTVFLLGGLIPLGMAVDRTGTAEWIATGVVGALGDSLTPLLLLSVLAVMSGAFCLVISNVGACTLLVPLGVSMASQIGIDPRVAAIVVGLGVSNSFLLPTHQVNALYMGPGDYRTKDYMKIGGVMSLVYVAVLVSMTYLFYT